MRNLIVTICIAASISFASAQKVIEKNIDYKRDQYIELEVKFASEIEVKTWDKPTVYLEASIYTKDGKYLDLYSLDVNETSSSIHIESNAEPILKKIWEDHKRNNPNKRRYYSDDDYEHKFDYILYVPKNAKFKISSINGDLKSEIIEGDFEAELINGDIDILQYAGNLELSTINGEIDLKMLNANLVAETIHGDIYADEKLKFTSTKRHVGQKISGRTADGKNRLRLNTINGNMYLRL